MTTIVGIDPGANETGIVVRAERELVTAWTVDRGDQEDAGYLIEVLETIELAFDAALQRLGLPRLGPVTLGIPLAVEGLVGHESAPSMRRKTSVPLIRTAMLIGAVLVVYRQALVIPPGGNGSGPLQAYPEAITPDRPNARGFDKLRHCRSAWDVAGAGLKELRYRDQA